MVRYTLGNLIKLAETVAKDSRNVKAILEKQAKVQPRRLEREFAVGFAARKMKPKKAVEKKPKPKPKAVALASAPAPPPVQMPVGARRGGLDT